MGNHSKRTAFAVASGSRSAATSFDSSDLTGLLDRPIAYHRIFAHVCGDPIAAIFLSQAFFWSPRTRDSDGWFYKTQAEWFSETGLTRRHQETARKKLVSLGILEEVRRGIPAQLFFRVDVARLAELIRAFLDRDKGEDDSGKGEESGQSRMADSAKQGAPTEQSRTAGSANQERRVAPDQEGAPRQPLTGTKSTTENTPKTTTAEPDVVADEDVNAALLAQMQAVGVSDPVAKRLIREKPDVCRQQLEWLPLRDAKKPSGALVTAIREEWAPPEKVQELARQQEAEQKRERAHRADEKRRTEEDAKRCADEERLAEENRQLDAYFAELPDSEKQAIEAETKRRLGILATRASQAAILAMRRNLLRPELGFVAL